MTRFARPQADLFAPAQAASAMPEQAPLLELTELLRSLRDAERMPWPDAAAAMGVERHALGLAGLAGLEGERLASAILQETERLLVAAETAPH